MNVVVFWTRISFGLIVGVGCFVEFGKGNIPVGLAVLGTAFFTLLPPLLLVRRGQRPTPITDFQKEFDLYVLAGWLRAFVGYLCGWGGFSQMDRDPGFPSIGLLVIGWFLLTPLQHKIFTYRAQETSPAGKRKWDGNATVLFFIRSFGLFLLLEGVLNYNERGLRKGSIVFMIVGILLILIRQLKKLVVKEKVGTPAVAVTSSSWTPVATSSIVDREYLIILYDAFKHARPDKQSVAYVKFLNELFAQYHFSARTVFFADGQQISGSFEIEGQVYILAARWQPEKTGQDELLLFNAKIEAKSTWARGIFISQSGFTAEGLTMFAQGKRTSMIGMDGADLELILHSQVSLIDAIRRKARRAVETNQLFVPLQELL
jgi:hypothetical protein